MLDGDILCLQEVGVDYHPHLANALEQLGYNGTFAQKALGQKEGVATFYKTDKFKLVQEKTVFYKDMLSSAVSAAGLDPAVATSGATGHVFLALQLQAIAMTIKILYRILTLFLDFRDFLHL